MGIVNDLINETLNENFDLGAFKKYLDGSLSGILKEFIWNIKRFRWCK